MSYIQRIVDGMKYATLMAYIITPIISDRGFYRALRNSSLNRAEATEITVIKDLLIPAFVLTVYQSLK